MKKALIAGTVSLAVAAMPVVGVFAADTTSQTDKLSVTIDATCTFKNVGTTEDPKYVEHNDGTSGVGTWTSDTLAGTMLNGTNTDNFGTTTFTVVCNNTTGWKVTNTMADLKSGENKISPNAGHSATVSGYSWRATQVADNGLTLGGVADATDTMKKGAAGEVASFAGTTDANGKTFTVTYGVGVAQDQAAGTYTGDVVYTLATM